MAQAGLQTLQRRCHLHIMPPKRSARAKREARQASLLASNAKLVARRQALRTLNQIVATLGFLHLRVDVKLPETSALDKMFRFLARRELDVALAQRCADAVKLFVQSGGRLPDGITLRDTGAGLHATESTFPVVPGHKVCTTGFKLRAKTFMVTYNSSSFTPAIWPAFETWVKAFAGKYGARAWAACLEKSLHTSSQVAAGAASDRYSAAKNETPTQPYRDTCHVRFTKLTARMVR